MISELAKLGPDFSTHTSSAQLVTVKYQLRSTLSNHGSLHKVGRYLSARAAQTHAQNLLKSQTQNNLHNSNFICGMQVEVNRMLWWMFWVALIGQFFYLTSMSFEIEFLWCTFDEFCDVMKQNNAETTEDDMYNRN